MVSGKVFCIDVDPGYQYVSIFIIIKIKWHLIF
jgi:hypothetical protein